MSLILVASIVKMVLVNPEYSAWIAEEVLLIAMLRCKGTDSFINLYFLGSNRKRSISELGIGYCRSDDYCWRITNADCILLETLPNFES